MGRARCLLLESFVCSFFRILCVISSSVTASSHWSERERKIGRERAKRGRERERKRKREGERRVEEKEREERARGGGVPPPAHPPLCFLRFSYLFLLDPFTSLLVRAHLRAHRPEYVLDLSGLGPQELRHGGFQVGVSQKVHAAGEGRDVAPASSYYMLTFFFVPSSPW